MYDTPPVGDSASMIFSRNFVPSWRPRPPADVKQGEGGPVSTDGFVDVVDELQELLADPDVSDDLKQTQGRLSRGSGRLKTGQPP